MNFAYYFTAASVLAAAPIVSGDDVDIVVHSQSVYYGLDEKEFSFEISGKAPGAKDGEIWKGALKSDGVTIGVAGMVFYAATWRASVPDGLRDAVLTMKSPESAVFVIRDRKSGEIQNPFGTEVELGDLEGKQPDLHLSVFCAARAKVKVVGEDDRVIDDVHLSGMTLLPNSPLEQQSRNIPFTSVGTEPGVFLCEPTTGRVSVVVTKEGYEPARVVIDCGTPNQAHRAILREAKKKPLDVGDAIEGAIPPPDKHSVRVTLKQIRPPKEGEKADEEKFRKGTDFDKKEDGGLAWGNGYPVRLAVRMDPPQKKYRLGDILSRTFLIHNVSDRTIEFESAASLSHTMSMFKKVVPGREAERKPGEVFDTDEGVYQQVVSSPRDKNIVRHRIAPGEIAEIPFSPMRLGEGPMPGPPGKVVRAKVGDYLLMTYQLQPYFLSEKTISPDADWRVTIRTGNMYLRVEE